PGRLPGARGRRRAAPGRRRQVGGWAGRMNEFKETAEPVVEQTEQSEQPTSDAEGDGKRGRRRSRTMSRKEIARELRRQRAFGLVDRELEEVIREIEARRPRSRADCASGPRPCMFISCKHHLYLDVNPATGSIKLNFPDKEVWELNETCALDVADRGGITLEEVGSIMNLTRERIRQVETRGLLKLRAVAEDEPRSAPPPGGDDGF
ncbi:MAG TPA: sigma factor-like helix-turn-helix DNA-binding protein, partial [Anaeromyxobacteraceae bacterium]|nr:sigma factor-like helix-turn-helix DNA-binding protein [Anaeromyxobacteraceae bacterium]